MKDLISLLFFINFITLTFNPDKKLAPKEIIVMQPAFLLYPLMVLILLLCRSTTGNNDQKRDTYIHNIGYDLINPDETIILPPVLHEISGISVIDSSSVACIQDENGIVFLYDINRKEITKYLTFYGNGDYEDIAYVNGRLFVIRSDATLFEIRNLEESEIAEKIKPDEIPHRETESLCYDSINNRLLVAPKDKADKDSESKVKRGVYAFDLTRGKLNKKPVFDFSLSSIMKYAEANDIIYSEEQNDKKKKVDIKFKPSSMAIHPVTGKLFLISAEDQMLFVFDMNGNIENIIYLDPYLFTMPEGITFFANGDMLISNEGRNMRPTILKFKYRKPLLATAYSW